MGAQTKIKATSTGTPPLAGAEAFSRLLVKVMAKRPDLKLVDSAPAVAELAKHGDLHKIANC